MKNFSQLITEPNVSQRADTNEFVGVFLTAMVLSYACGPLFGGGNNDSKGGSGASFWDFLIARQQMKQDKKKEEDSKKSESGKDESKNNETFNSLLMLSRQANEKEKDANTKKKNDAMIKLITACSFDKDGKEVPLDQIADKMKDNMSPEQFEAFKKDMTDTYEKNKDNQDFKDQLAKAKANIKPEEYDKMIEDAKAEAKSTLEQLDKEKKEIEEYDKKLQELNDQINGGDEKDKEIRELKKQLEELKKNPPQTLAGAATGVASTGATTTTDGEGEPDPNGEPEGKKPEDYSNDDIDALQNEISELDPEKDKDKIKEKNDLLKSVAKAKGKSEDEYEVKVETSSDGKPVQRKTGPLGGKYFRTKQDDGSWSGWQNGEPNESYKLSLRDYLLECLI